MVGGGMGWRGEGARRAAAGQDASSKGGRAGSFLVGRYFSRWFREKTEELSGNEKGAEVVDGDVMPKQPAVAKVRVSKVAVARIVPRLPDSTATVTEDVLKAAILRVEWPVATRRGVAGASGAKAVKCAWTRFTEKIGARARGGFKGDCGRHQCSGERRTQSRRTSSR